MTMFATLSKFHVRQADTAGCFGMILTEIIGYDDITFYIGKPNNRAE